ncbi:MAG: head decoration protein [Peptococcaceae bacterium]|nr:head decoration protein [Peptococcaceae bacterium]
MPKNLIESLGTVGYDNLINSNVPVADVFTAKIRGLAAKPTYKRGTVLAFSSGTAGDNKLVILGTEAAENETLTPNCILAEDVTLDSGDTFAIAYRTGHFNRNALLFAEEYTFTDADEEALRNAGILLSDAVDYIPAYEEE